MTLKELYSKVGLSLKGESVEQIVDKLIKVTYVDIQANKVKFVLFTQDCEEEITENLLNREFKNLAGKYLVFWEDCNSKYGWTIEETKTMKELEKRIKLLTPCAVAKTIVKVISDEITVVKQSQAITL